MNKLILRFVFFATIFAVGFNAQQARASHAAGAELLYNWISGSTYQITFKFYRDCSGIAAPPTVTVCYLNSCNAISGSLILNNTGPVNGTNLPIPCPNQPNLITRCQSATATLPGYQEYIYTGTINLQSQCNSWYFYTSINARNNQDNITNGSQGFNLYCEAELNNQVAQGNSSPVFTIKPVPFLCINVPYTYNNGATDPNNDSLGFEFIQPRSHSGTCVQNLPIGAADCPYSNATFNLATNPLICNNTFSFNTQTGMMAFTPSALQTSTVTVRVSDYRNGVKIGSVLRDIQIKVIGCTVPQPTVSNDINSLVGCVLANNTIKGCATMPMSFCFDVKIPDTTIDMNVTDNSAQAAPGSTLTYSNQLTDSVRGCFSWTPTAADTGLKILVINAQACNTNAAIPPITQSFTIPIYIWPATVARADTLICRDDSVQMNVTGGGNFVWSVLPGGSPVSSLSCVNCRNPVAKPTVTTSYVVTSTENAYCPNNKDTVVVTVAEPPSFDLGPDITTCVNNPVQLNANFTPAPGNTYTTVWTPTTWLNNPNITNPITDPKGDIQYILTITPLNLIGCARKDTINITTLMGYEIQNPDTAICLGDAVQIRAAGDLRYTFNWTPALGVSDPAIINPLITPAAIGTYTYTVTASYPNCRDSLQEVKIEVEPVPTVDIGADVTLCYGDTIHIEPTINPDTYPNYSYSWTPAGDVNNNLSKNVVYTAFKDTKPLTLTVTTPAGCTGSDTKDITVVQTDFLIASNDTAICPGDRIQLMVDGSVLDVRWTPNEKIDDTSSNTPWVNPLSTITYTVSARDVNNCVDTADVTVEVKPGALLSVPDSVVLYPGETYRMDPLGNALYYTWFPQNYLSNPSIANPLANPPVNTRYYVVGKTEFGCMATDSIDIIVKDDSYIDMPNAFSPGSEPNSVLKPVHLGAAKLKSFKVFNRWGLKVFESTDLEKGWDGTYNGEPQPMGVYIYLVEAETYRGKKVSKQGNVTLMR